MMYQDSWWSSERDRVERLGELACVCRLFQRICQGILFKHITLKSSTGSWLGRVRPIVYWRQDPTSKLIKPFEKGERQSWRKELYSIIQAEWLLRLIGNHPFLALQPQTLHVKGFAGRRDSYPADPLHRPARSNALSRPLFDELQRFRMTLSVNLPALENLHDLQLSFQVIDNDLLGAIDMHPTLKQLGFEFCWFPEETRPLSSIKSLKIHEVPGSHIGPKPFPPRALDRGLYEGVPNHHLLSAFNLISPDNLQQLDLKLECRDSVRRSVFKHLSDLISQRPLFRQLGALNLTFHSAPNDFILLLLKRAPALRELRVDGLTDPWTHGFIPPQAMHRLKKLVCPLDWARFFLHGRTIQMLEVVGQPATRITSNEPSFLAPTKADLEAYLGPLALSQISRLNLPSHPPLAPVWVLMPYLSTLFQNLTELRCAISGTRIHREYIFFIEGLRSGPLPDKDTVVYDVSEQEVDALVKEIRSCVDAKFLLAPITQPSADGLGTTSASVSHQAPKKKWWTRLKARSVGKLFTFRKSSLDSKQEARGEGSSERRSLSMKQGSPLLTTSNSNLPVTSNAETLSRPSTPAKDSVTGNSVASLEIHQSFPATSSIVSYRVPSPISPTRIMDEYFSEIDRRSGLPLREPCHASVSHAQFLVPCILTCLPSISSTFWSRDTIGFLSAFAPLKFPYAFQKGCSMMRLRIMAATTRNGSKFCRSCLGSILLWKTSPCGIFWRGTVPAVVGPTRRSTV
jgi:hypothetical protein